MNKTYYLLGTLASLGLLGLLAFQTQMPNTPPVSMSVFGVLLSAVFACYNWCRLCDAWAASYRKTRENRVYPVRPLNSVDDTPNVNPFMD